MKTILLLLLLAPSLCLGAINYERIDTWMSSGEYANWASYNIGMEEGQVYLDVDLKLLNPANNLGNFESTIESIWSTDSFRYPVLTNVDFLEPGSPEEANHLVDIIPGYGRSNAYQWYTGEPLVAAHEFGHMIGVYDSYLGGALNPEGTVEYGRLMGDNTPILSEWYFDHIFAWADAQTDDPIYGGGGINVPIGGDPAPVPEPGTLLLMGLGAAGYAIRRKIKA